MTVTRKILLIEDDPDDQRDIAGFFKGRPYEILTAPSNERAIAILEEHTDVRVVVLDLALGDKSGEEVLKHINRDGRASEYRVIVLTGHQNMLRARRAHGYDVFTYLVKAQDSAESVRFSVDQAINDLERAHLNAKLERLLDVQKKINAHAPLKKILDLVCRSVLSTVGGYTCHIRVYHFNRGDYFTEGYAGAEEQRSIFDTPRAKGHLFSGEVVTTRKPALFGDLQNDPRFRNFAELSLKDRSLTEGESQYWKSVNSAYLVPISTGSFEDQVDAVLNVNSEKLAFFTPDKCAIVDEFVNLATLAITRDWLHRKRQDVHADYKAIARMLGDLSQRQPRADLHHVYSVVMNKISEIVNPEILSIFIYDETAGILELCAERRGDEVVKNPIEFYRPDQSVTGKVFSRNETIHLPEKGTPAEEDERFDRDHRDHYLQNIPSGVFQHYLGVPISIGGKPRGVLRAVNKRSELWDHRIAPTNPLCLLDRGFSADCRNAMEIAATHLAIAIHTSELFVQKEHQLKQLETIAEIGNLINSERALPDVLRKTITMMARVMGAEICLLFLKDDGGQNIVLREHYGLGNNHDLEGASYQLGEGVTGTVAATGMPQRIGRASASDGKYDREIESILMTHNAGEPKRIESLMVVPIRSRERGVTFGAMKVINKAGDDAEYNEDDLALFGIFADYVAVAIANAEANEALDRKEHDVEDRNRSLSLLVRAVAHEINNSFGIIPTNIDVVRQRLKKVTAPIDRLLTRIDEAARQASDFANKIAGFSATHAVKKEHRDLNDLVVTAIETIDKGRFDPARRIHIVNRLSRDELMCEVYASSFSQCVRNIVTNAYQALSGKDDGTITLSSERGSGANEGKAVIRFKDNGPGIQREHLERIFEPEFTTKTGDTGSGVGLWLVRDQLKIVDGTISVESEPGLGATFIVTVPLLMR